MLLSHFLTSIACLLALVNGSTTPSSDVALSRQGLSSTRDVIINFVDTPVWTTKDIALSPLSIDAGVPDTQVVLAVIASNVALAGGLCAIGVIPACITGAAIAALTNFYLVYATMGTSNGPARRDIAGITANIHDLWLPSESSSTVFKLKTNTIDGVWTPIGNTTINGLYHEVHFRQLGSMLGVKAIQSAAGAKNRRDDAADDGGYVAAYFWEDNNQQAWNDWNGAQVEPIGDEIGDFISSNNGQVVCANIIDQDGPMNAGVMTMDDYNDEYGLTQSQWASALSICLAGDPSVP
ncbi:hypothetical protein SBOR_3524 [Sclerotinia borealis F-4128]|uniref:Uncharacterized protein n=1 Tax=Sclerotinia borealis (strain F-4128) TaxID=1432307 RepID=W9CH33_SCLBF|nr:hypothetical protein SBOR_3524 [Sclerotinia borealis F-4128]